jgi:hypothetical protein
MNRWVGAGSRPIRTWALTTAAAAAAAALGVHLVSPWPPSHLRCARTMKGCGDGGCLLYGTDENIWDTTETSACHAASAHRPFRQDPALPMAWLVSRVSPPESDGSRHCHTRHQTRFARVCQVNCNRPKSQFDSMAPSATPETCGRARVQPFSRCSAPSRVRAAEAVEATTAAFFLLQDFWTDPRHFRGPPMYLRRH